MSAVTLPVPGASGSVVRGHRTIAVLSAALVCLIIALLAVAVWRYGPWQPPAFSEWPMLVRGDVPAALVVAPDDSVWFTIENSNALGVLRAGRLERLPKGRENLEPLGLAVGRAGDVWFTDAIAESIGHVRPDGSFEAFRLPTGITQFGRLALAPDGSVWFTDSWSNSIVSLKDGQFTPYLASTAGASPFGVAVDATGTVWATLQAANRLVRITPDGQKTELELPTRSAGPSDVAIDASGAVWFIEMRVGKLGRYAGGRFSEASIPTSPQAGLTSLAVAPDGSVWLTALREHKLIRQRGESSTDFRLPRADARPFAVAVDSGGTVWYTDLAGYVGSLHAHEAQASGLDPRALLPREWLAR